MIAMETDKNPRSRRIVRKSPLLAFGFTCVLACTLHGQQAPKPPFTAKDAELGKKLADLSLDVREQIADPKAPADPFKIMGNLYFVGVANGEAYLLTSPQGHILFGVG